MWLCPGFWTLPSTSQAGTLIHEATHYLQIGNTVDEEYGYNQCKLLAQYSPLQAIKNADSYQHFAENNPPI